MNQFNALIHILLTNTHPVSVPCQHLHPLHPFIPSVEAKLQRLFVEIYRLGMQAYEAGHRDQARWIISDLAGALNKCPELYDSRKRDILLDMAELLGKLGHQGGREDILWKIAAFCDKSSPASDKHLYQLLSESLQKSSEIIREYFKSLWEKENLTPIPLNHVVPPLFRAAQNPNKGVVLATLSRMNAVSYPKLLHQHEMQTVAAAFDFQSTGEIDKFRAIADVRDFHDRTPLFIAAADGCDNCCWALLQAKADPDSRDSNMHTPLEMAIRGGHDRIFGQLIAAGCNVNPQLVGCASSPLQAAIESNNTRFVDILLKNGANVDDKRPLDGKSAIDLAEEKNHAGIAWQMRQTYSKQRPGGFFNLGYPEDLC